MLAAYITSAGKTINMSLHSLTMTDTMLIKRNQNAGKMPAL